MRPRNSPISHCLPLFVKAAMFLSCLATDICVGLSSWVDVDSEKGYEENADKVELQHLLDVLRSLGLSTLSLSQLFTLQGE